MRTIILLLAVLALVGFAAAWDTQEKLTYSYQKTVAEQAGQHLNWLLGTSGATSSSTTGYGTATSSLSNTIAGVWAPLISLDGKYEGQTSDLFPDTHNSVIASGTSVISTSAPDLENPAGLKFAGQATTSAEVDLSGNYGGINCGNAATSALINQNVAVSVDGVSVTGTGTGTVDAQRLDNSWIKASGTVLSLNDHYIEANIGQSTSAGFEQINAPGALPTMSGETAAWAGFSGAYGASPVDVTTAVGAAGTFHMTF